MRILGYSLLGLFVAGAVGGMPAQAGCWTNGDADAARVREFQTMLMVATLKCQAAGIDVSAPYNGFVTARRQLLEGANGRLRQHFASDGGQAGYDRFVTILANGYGAEETTAESCGQVAQLAVDAAAVGADLAGISAGQVATRTLAGGLCAPAAAAVTVAAAAPRPPAAAPPVSLASTAAAAEKPSLPAEVVAAMAVIAAYTRDQAAAAPAASPPVATAMLAQPATR